MALIVACLVWLLTHFEYCFHNQVIIEGCTDAMTEGGFTTVRTVLDSVWWLDFGWVLAALLLLLLFGLIWRSSRTGQACMW